MSAEVSVCSHSGTKIKFMSLSSNVSVPELKSQTLQIFDLLLRPTKGRAELLLCAVALLDDSQACDDCLLNPTPTEHCYYSSHANMPRSPAENWTHTYSRRTEGSHSVSSLSGSQCAAVYMICVRKNEEITNY